MIRFATVFLVWLALAPAASFSLAPALAQDLRITNVEIVAGEPFGIGKVTIEPGAGDLMTELTDGFRISDREGRIFYPVMSQRLIDKVIDNLDETSPQSSRRTFWFLVRGQTPLDLRISGATTVERRAEVQRARPGPTRRLIRQWWREYGQVARQRANDGNYPPLLDAYLQAMLAKRLGLEPETLLERLVERDPLRSTLDLLFDVESFHAGVVSDLMMRPRTAAALRPLPQPPRWSTGLVALPPPEIAVEPIAEAVPVECFYLRFGSWENQIWLTKLLGEYGGDLSRLVQVRGHAARGSTDLLGQLALQSTEWDELFGGRVVADMAFIGTDTALKNRPSIGVLFQSKGELFLKNLSSRRARLVRENAAAGYRLEQLKIGEHPLTLVSTPDGSIRSFLVSHENYHLVTSSVTLAERFLEAVAGQDRLADDPEFRIARRLLPLEREDTLFVFASTAFFHTILSPTYQIESRRRSYATATERIEQCARLCAQGEGLDPDDRAGLVAAGLLPAALPELVPPPRGGTPADAAMFAQATPGVPLADVRIATVTAEEAEWYAERATYFSERIGRFDPMCLAIKRFGLDAQRERLVVDARIAPFSPVKYEQVGLFLGPPLEEQAEINSADPLTFQMSLRAGESGKPCQMFVVVEDQPVTLQALYARGLMQTLELIRSIPGCLGAYPEPGVLDRLLFGFGGRADADGFKYSRLLQLWRLERDRWALVGADRDRLLAAMEKVHMVPSPTPAAIRLHVADLRETQLLDLANWLFYRRAWRTSLANVQLVNHLARQFRLPPQEAWGVAESLLNVRLVCSLAGDYECDATHGLWTSSGWPAAAAVSTPPDYQAPLLAWFRGLDAEVIQAEQQFVVHATLDVEREKGAAGNSLPGFENFRGFDPIESLKGLFQSK